MEPLQSRDGLGSKFGSFLPDYRVTSLQEIDFEQLAELGVKHLVLDVDNTVVQVGGSEIKGDVAQFLLLQWEKGLIQSISLASNSPRNLAPMAKAMDAKVFQPHGNVRKPNPEYFREIVKALNCSAPEAVMVGDKLIYDIPGANKVGMVTILVEPLGPDLLIDKMLLRRARERRLLNKLLGPPPGFES